MELGCGILAKLDLATGQKPATLSNYANSERETGAGLIPPVTPPLGLLGICFGEFN